MKKSYISQLQSQLKKHANRQTKDWFENYLKGSIKYYGVKTPQVKKIVIKWRADNKLDKLTTAKQLALCMELFAQEHAEEKFAATIYLETYLIKLVDSEKLLKFAQTIYANNYIYDWSTADWFSIRVLAKIINNDETAIARISNWSNNNNLWQRRASIVALRTVVKDKKYTKVISQVIHNLVDDSQRFIQTGIGWVISDLSKLFPKEASYLVERYFDQLSVEVIRRHTKYLPKHKLYIARKNK